MQDSHDRATPPHDPTPGAPRSGKPSHPRGGNDAARVRFAAVAAGLAVLASALVNRDVLATWLGVALAVAGVVMGIVALVRARELEQVHPHLMIRSPARPLTCCPGVLESLAQFPIREHASDNCGEQHPWFVVAADPRRKIHPTHSRGMRAAESPHEAAPF